jgi:hypothetical protein
MKRRTRKPAAGTARTRASQYPLTSATAMIAHRAAKGRKETASSRIARALLGLPYAASVFAQARASFAAAAAVSI